MSDQLKNPFAEHAGNMQAYLDMLSPPLAGVTGNTVFYKSNVKPQGETYPAAVGPFALQQLLRPDGGGFAPGFVRLAEVIIQKSDLPAGIVFKTGTSISVTMPGGSVYPCQVFMAEDVYAEWRLQLQDVNYQG